MNRLSGLSSFERLFLTVVLVTVGVAVAPPPAMAKGFDEFCFCGTGFCDPGFVLCCDGTEFQPPCDCFAISPTRCG